MNEIFADYLDGKISEKELENYFSENPGSRQEFEELKQLFEELPEDETLEVSVEADKNFYTFLEQQKKPKISIWKKEIFKYAAMFLAVSGAYYFGTKKETIVTVEKPVYLTQTIRDTIKVKEEETAAVAPSVSKSESKVMNELANIKKEVGQINEVQHKMILAMLRQESAASRLQAINYSYELDQVDGTLMQALFQTLEMDPSVNVKLAALEAVGRFELNANMREALVMNLTEERDPSLQLALINKLIELREVKALPVFAGMVSNASLSDRIRSQAEFGVKVLNM